MNYKSIIILFLFIGFSLINTTTAASTKSTFDNDNKTLTIYNSKTDLVLLTIQQISVKPDLVSMEEVFKITSNEDYTFIKNKDFNVLSQKFNGKNNIRDSKWEILETMRYTVNVPDFELKEKNLTISNIQTFTDVTEIFDAKPWRLDWGVNSKEKWEIISLDGNGTIGFSRYEITTIYPLNITFFWYENEPVGSHQETRFRDDWKPFLPDGKTIKKNENYVVKLTFYKQAENGRFSIKTIPRFADVDEDRLTWWNASWEYSIDNKISNGARPYQLTLNLSNSMGVNNATHVFLNGHANINFTDVRFTLDNTTPLSYWIEKGTGKVWVNVTANGTVNLYYGNPSATDSSDGKKTFEFFDDFEPESWQKIQKLPAPFADQAGAVLNGKIYTIGGYDTSYTVPTGLVYAYDPVTDSYQQKANLNFARWGPACTGYGNNIYCFGGLPNHMTEKYDPGTNTWITLPEPPLPLQDQGLTAVVGGAYIYLFRNGDLYQYDPSTDTYLPLPNAPLQTLTNWPSMAYYNNEIYILGGYLSGGVNYVNIYNLTTNVWRNGASMPIGLYGTLRENPVINDKIYILQGQGIWSNYDFFSRFWVYNIVTDSWSWGELGYWDADGVSGGVIGNKIYTFGGRRGHDIYDRGTDFAGVLDTTKNVPVKWIDVKPGAWREDESSLTNGLFQYYPLVQIRTEDQVVNTNNKVISRMKYPGGSSGYGGLIIQSNEGVYRSNNKGYLDPFINITANKDELRRHTESSSTLLGTRSLSSSDVWHTYITYYGSSSIISTRDGANEIVASDGTYRGGYIQVFKSDGFDLVIDYIAVARYVTPEPAWSSWSKESSSTPTPIDTATTTPTPTHILIEPLAIDFGEMKMDHSKSTVVTISNTGKYSLTVSAITKQEGWDDKFSIAAAPSFPVIIPPGGNQYVNIIFAPSAVGHAATSVLEIASNDLNQPIVLVRFNGEGVAGETAPSAQIDDILAFIDDSVAAGTLHGEGPDKSAANRLDYLKKRIEASRDLIDRGDSAKACSKLQEAYDKTDGRPKPPDFIDGSAASELAGMIQNLRESLGCQ